MGDRKTAPKKPPPAWATPVHYVQATACGNARRGHRLTHDSAEVTCRFCVVALKQAAEKKRRP